jgi:S-adenosylmethionine hydrolase
LLRGRGSQGERAGPESIIVIVTLTTDFGTRDSYVAQLKGALLSRAPEVTVVDVTHDIAPQDVLGGALVLEEAVPWFPPGTVHLAVVDPGVGSARAPLVVVTGRELLVGPDNGLLSLAAAGSTGSMDDAGGPKPAPRLYRIDEQRLPAPPSGTRRPGGSATFHGRDVFAPAAAWLAGGGGAADIGSRVEAWVSLAVPSPTEQAAADAGRIALGTVLAVDRFGNLITNLRPEPGSADRASEVELAGQPVGPLRRTYSDVAPGELLALVGSSGRLEIAVRDGSAAGRLAQGRGATVRLWLREARP